MHAYGWVTIVILSMVKTRTSNILTGYGPTIPLEQSNHWKEDCKFFIKLVITLFVVATRVSELVATTNPNLNYWALSVKRWT
jgi:hypothetical protein